MMIGLLMLQSLMGRCRLSTPPLLTTSGRAKDGTGLQEALNSEIVLSHNLGHLRNLTGEVRIEVAPQTTVSKRNISPQSWY